jgi:hypothetical protein
LYKKIFDQHRKSFFKVSFLDGIQLWFLNTKIWFDDDFLVDIFRCLCILFFFEFFKGAISLSIFNAIGISPLVMFLLEILWWLHHLSIFLLSLFFSLVDFFVSGQHIDLPLFPLALGAKWKNLCIIFCFCLKIWTRPPRLGRSSRNFRSSLRYFG